MKIEIQRKGKSSIFFTLLAVAFMLIYGGGSSASAQTSAAKTSGANNTQENKVEVYGVLVVADPEMGRGRQQTCE